MKKIVLLFACILLATYIVASSIPNDYEGTYISEDGDYKYTLTSDSLFVDMAGSGCGISSFKLITKEKYYSGMLYYAEEFYSQDEKTGNTYIYLKKDKGNKYLIEFRDNKYKSKNTQVFYIFKKH